MNVSFLREDALQYGPDLNKWPVERQRAAVIRLYELDEGSHPPCWMADALADWCGMDSWREAVLRGLKETDITEHATSLASCLRTPLFLFPLNWLSQQCAENYWTWQREQAQGVCA